MGVGLPDAVNQDDKIWRYLDLAKFLAMLVNRGIYFATADEFDDPYEGYFPTVKEAASVEDQLIKAAWPLMRRTYFDNRKKVRISCWHRNPGESEAMWSRYLQNGHGIAIQSTPRRLYDAISKTAAVQVGDVEYFDVARDLRVAPQVIAPFFWKRRSFEHEREVRAVLTDAEAHSSGTVSVDLNSLILEVVISPKMGTWFIDVVKTVAAKFDLAAPITTSALASPPDWSDVAHIAPQYVPRVSGGEYRQIFPEVFHLQRDASEDVTEKHINSSEDEDVRTDTAITHLAQSVAYLEGKVIALANLSNWANQTDIQLICKFRSEFEDAEWESYSASDFHGDTEFKLAGVLFARKHKAECHILSNGTQLTVHILSWWSRVFEDGAQPGMICPISEENARKVKNPNFVKGFVDGITDYFRPQIEALDSGGK